MHDANETAHVYQEVCAANKRIGRFVRRTPLTRSTSLPGRPLLKLENVQVTGSFKARGAFNKVLSLSSERREAGIVAASTGNHGLAVAHSLARTGVRGVIYLPETAASRKVQLLEHLGADLRFYGKDALASESEARRIAANNHCTYLSPYNDPDVVAGQGTVAAELLSQSSTLDTLFVAVGGGGLIGGMAAYAKHVRPGIQIVGCSPRSSPVMHASVAAGKIVEVPMVPTLSDGTAGSVENDAITFPLCSRLVDEWHTVEEDAIADAMRFLYRKESIMIEGAAGVVVAAWLQHAGRFANSRVALILCGGNIDAQWFRK